MSKPAELRRELSLSLVILYGLGTTVGAGIYALIGEVAGGAGMAAPVAFAIASALAGASALSFAELSARFPEAAGEAAFVREGIGLAGLPTFVGLLVVLAGVVSSAAIANGFIGYLGELVDVPRDFGVVAIVLLLGGVAGWGIGPSVRLAGLITVIEIAGLLLVVWASRASLAMLPDRLGELLPVASFDAWRGILGASLLAFYAFIGFEDMVNVAEEVKQVRRTLPLAIVATLILTTGLYVLLATTAVLAVAPEELARSEAPLALVWERGTGRSPAVLGAIGVIAMVNGALIQLVMAPRVLYGLARRGGLPRRLARVNAYTGTPLLATGIATALTALLALFFPLAELAAATSLITLVIFALVNLALFRLKGRAQPPGDVPNLPRWVPLLGLLTSASFAALALARWGSG